MKESTCVLRACPVNHLAIREVSSWRVEKKTLEEKNEIFVQGPKV